MNRLLVAAALMLSAVSASAYEHIVVAPDAACPASTYPVTPSYEWRDGRLVLNGYVCSSVYTGR